MVMNNLRCMLLFGCCLLSACSASSRPEPVLLPQSVAASQAGGGESLPDGLISIARPIPPLTPDFRPELLAFSPAAERQHPWIEIESRRQKLILREGSNRLTVANLQSPIPLAAGSYQIVHKQRGAPWYASDEYFINRGLPVPPPADKSRFLRGALGDYALFVDQDTPIHCGPLWSVEIGGLLINEQDCAKIYYQVPVGALVKIK